MHLESQQLKTGKDTLAFWASGLEVRAFGSRVTGERLKRFSDLALVLMTKQRLPIRDYTRVKDAFTLSDSPFRVDVPDWTKLSDDFLKAIEKQYEVVQGASEIIAAKDCT